MTDVDPIGEHGKPNESMSDKPKEDKNIPFTPGGVVGGSSWEPE